MVEQASHQISAGETAVVVGAGLAGLLAAAALSDFFKNVVVVERDRLPTRPGLRKGVPQGAHVHTLLGYAVEAFDQLVPGMIGRLYEAGAVRIRRNQDIWFHDMVGPTPIRDVGILTPSVTRPLLEHVAGDLIFRKPNVTLREGTRLVSFLSDAAHNVCGVALNSDAGGDETISAELVIDCSGRGSRLPDWLQQQGYDAVEAQQLDINMGYTSGTFRPPPKWRDSSWACLMLAIPPSRRAAYISPVDGGHWVATTYGRGGEFAPRDLEGFLEWTRGLAHPVVHDRLAEAELVGQLRSYNIPTGIWRRYDRMERFPDGVLPAGEGFTSFNPMYGQGISLAAGQALALRAALKQSAPSGGDPLRGLALAYFAGCFELNAQAWSVMETRDLAFPSTQGLRPADFDERWRVSHAIRRLAEVDPDVHRLSVRVLHLMEPTSALQDPKIMQRAMALAGET